MSHRAQRRPWIETGGTVPVDSSVGGADRDVCVRFRRSESRADSPGRRLRSPGEFRRTERRPREAHRGKIIAVREKRNGRTESDPIGTGRVAGGLRGSVVPARPTRGGPPRGAYRPVLSVRRRSTAPSHGGRSSDSIGVCRARGPDPARSPAPPDAQGTGEILGWGATITDGRVRASDRDRGRRGTRVVPANTEEER